MIVLDICLVVNAPRLAAQGFRHVTREVTVSRTQDAHLEPFLEVAERSGALQSVDIRRRAAPVGLLLGLLLARAVVPEADARSTYGLVGRVG